MRLKFNQIISGVDLINSAYNLCTVLYSIGNAILSDFKDTLSNCYKTYNTAYKLTLNRFKTPFN